jgi:hypothetical protein
MEYADMNGTYQASVGENITFLFAGRARYGQQPSADVTSAALEDYTILRNPESFEGENGHGCTVWTGCTYETYAAQGVPLCSAMVREERVEGIAIICTVAPHPSNVYTPVINVAPWGWASWATNALKGQSAVLNIVPGISSLAVTSGGSAGGREVTIVGSGIVDWAYQMDVLIGGEPCEVISHTPDPWQLVFRQTIGHGWFSPGELSKNANDPTASMYSVLDTLETLRTQSDGKFTFKLVWPRAQDSWRHLTWRQGLNPTVSGAYCSNPLLTTKSECQAYNRWMPDVHCYNVDCGTVATLCTNQLFTTKNS